MPNISVIGICGNSIFLSVDRFHEKGETVVANARFEEIGGKGINQALAAARMGGRVSFLAAVGDDSDAKKCMTAIREAEIDGHFAIRKEESTTLAFILTDKTGENRVTVYPGAQLRREDVLAFEAQIACSDILLLQQEVPLDVNETAISLAQKHGVRVILNPAPIRPVPSALPKQVYLVTPNEHEKAGLGKLSYENCITTLGGEGCSINDETFIQALPVTAVDTTGAGDTFNGVLAVCLAEGMEMKEACRWAVTASGISVTRKGVWTAIPNRKEIERMIR